MTARASLFFCAVFGLTVLWNGPAASAQSWLNAYNGRSTDEFLRDSRTPALIRAKVHAPFDKELLDALGGPPALVNWSAGRYFTASACLYRYCPIKGFFWLDTRTGVAVGGVLTTEFPDYKEGHLRLDSRHIKGELPAVARQAVVDWLTHIGAEARTVSFSDALERVRAMNVNQFR